MIVSVVIPHFNRLELLKETVSSVQQQTYNNWEIVLVNNGSIVPEYEAVQNLKTHNIFVLQRKKSTKGPS